MTDTKPITHQI